VLNFALRISNDGGEPVAGAFLRVQVRIDPARRRFDAKEAERVQDLFGPRERWGETQRSLLWTHANLSLPAFSEPTTIALPVPCTLDLGVAATKLFSALEGGVIPLTFLFGGTVFFTNADGALSAAPIPWDSEARFELPVAAWHALEEQFLPNQGFLVLPRDLLRKLEAFKTKEGLPTLEHALERLLP
jgi:hypothetical protein